MVVGSQSVRTTESRDVRVYNAGRKIKGAQAPRNGDSDRLALKPQVHAADIQDHDGTGLAAASLTPKLTFRAAGRRACRLPGLTHGDGQLYPG